MRRREGPFLLALCLALSLPFGGCGPSGSWRAPDSENAEAERKIVRAPVRAGIRAVPGAPTTVRVDPQETWSRASAALRRWTQSAPTWIRIETSEGAVVWTPRHPAARDRPPTARLHVRLRLAADEEKSAFVGVWVHGSPWVARHGCGARASWRIPGWGESAARSVASDLDLFLDAVDHDPLRLHIALEVAGEVSDTVRWADVLPLLDACARAEVGVLTVGGLPAPRGRVARRFFEDAFQWLAAHQATDGRWPAADFGAWCDGVPMVVPASDGTGHPAYDVGATGLALCAFLGAGYTNRGRHPYAKRVARALRWLKQVQQPDGCFGDPHGPWSAESHAIATLALVEIFGMTASPLWKGAAQRGLDFLPSAYAASAADDHVSTFFTVAALASAQLVNEDARKREKAAPLSLPEPFTGEMRAYVSDPGGSGDVTLSAISIFGRIVLGGEPRKSPDLTHLAEAVARAPPVWDPERGTIDMPRWLFGSLALFQVGKAPWKRWNPALKEAVVSRQRRDGAFCCYRGSWDPHGPGARRFGRVGSTALMMLVLEVYYRYDRVFGTP